MNSLTLTYPSRDVFISTTRSRDQRRAYVRGLALLDDYTNSLDEARTGRPLFKQNLEDFAPFERAAESAGALRDSLFEGALTSSRLKPSGHGDRSLNEIALTEHLRLSIRERVLDLYDQTRARQSLEAYNESALTFSALRRDVSRMLNAQFPEPLIRGALGIDEGELEAASAATMQQNVFDVYLPHFNPQDRLAYAHTNSHGVTYYLHSTEITLRGGQPQTVYFFAKNEINDKGVPVRLPSDREVIENPRNGFLTLSKRGRHN